MSTTEPLLRVEIDFTTDLSAGLAYFEKVAADGPYVWHRLKEAAGTSMADSSGQEITGTIAGTYTLDQTAGKPVSGETASRYIALGGSGTSAGRISFPMPEGGFPGNSLSFEAWIYQASLSGSDTTVYWIATDRRESTRLVLLGDGRLRIESSLAVWKTTNVVVAAATWYHVVVTFDTANKAAAVYVNGASVPLTDIGGLDSPSRIRLGDMLSPWYWGVSQDSGPAGKTPVSRIAEPAAYTAVLQPSQVLDHYNAAATIPFAGYTWTDVTPYVLRNPGISRLFARQSSIEEVTPMEVSYTLVNDDRRFEVDNPESPYANVVPGRPTRVQMTQDGTTYDWAFGFIEDFPQTWDASGKFGRVPIIAHCFLERMNQHKLSGRQFRQQASGSRMTVLANIAGVPTAFRELGAGAHNVMEQAVESGTAGDHARQVARTDRGMVFFDGRGYMVFQDGNYRATNARATVSRGTLGPVGSVDIVTLGAPEFHAPEKLILNEITLRRPGGVDQVAVDSTSQSKYGPRSHSDELLLTTDAEISTRAADLLAAYKDPALRVQAIRFNPARSPGQWDHALGVRPSDRYTWVFRPQQGASISRDVFVEGVADRWVNAEYVATWFLSVAA